MPRQYVTGEVEQKIGFSRAVATKGGRTVWLAGVTGYVDEKGNSLAGNFQAQVQRIYEQLGKTMKEAGGKLQDIVQTTVFIKDARHGAEIGKIRSRFFSDNYPGSTLITVTGFAHADCLLEIHAIAVVGDE